MEQASHLHLQTDMVVQQLKNVTKEAWLAAGLHSFVGLTARGFKPLRFTPLSGIDVTGNSGKP